MDFDLLYPGRFLKSAEFKGRDVTLTIASIRVEELGEGKEAKAKGVITFHETKKALCLNKTNGLCLKAMFGRETDDWIGKKVTLYPAPFHDMITGEDTTAIRVRGSPDIEKTMTAEIQLPRKRPVSMTLAKTGALQRGKPGPKPATHQEPEPGASASDRREGNGVEKKIIIEDATGDVFGEPGARG